MNNNVYLLTRNLDIVKIPGLVNYLKNEDKTALIPEKTYIALSFNYEHINNVRNKIINGEKNIENKKARIKKNLLKENIHKTFDVWVKPINYKLQTRYALHNDPKEETPATLFKLYYEKIENCRIVCGLKEGHYGIVTNGVIFDHIPIQLFNEKKICSVIGDTYEILLFDPYE